ncbi:hypothetical protein R1flu_020654 [Riccia fluitans]|uniref:non-specific serine/threonine protein kinase n=1 Tax=Riccia fluitans TaxID=41844 RepID=A0ABD1ZNR9_9MARC
MGHDNVLRNFTQGRQHWRREFWTILLAGILVWNFPLIRSQDDSEFINIDCGGTGGLDPVTNMKWVTDKGFLDSASQLADEGVAVPALVKLNDSTASSRNNAEQLKTALAFIPGRSSRSKYCYNFTVNYTDVNSTSYLLRAMFPSRNLTANVKNQDKFPFDIYGNRFYFTVDSTFISTVDLDPFEPQTIELVVSTLDKSLYACLVPLEDRSSMPAISSLELRPLSQSLYPRASANGQSNTIGNTRVQTTYLMLVSRLNFGANASVPAVRYPHDQFDRLWYAPAIPEDKLLEFDSKERIVSLSTISGSEGEDNGTPNAVINTAWEGLNMSSEISFSFDIKRARAFRPIPSFYVNMMFTDVNPGENDTVQRFVDVTLEHTGPEFFSRSLWASDAKVQSNETSRWYNYKQAFFGSVATYRIKPSENSWLPSMVNAVEVLGEFDAITERTDQFDVLSVKALSGSFADKVDTAGDPCLPIPWDWIVCSIEIPPRITQINLTGKGLIGEIRFDERFGSLDHLTVLDVSNNSLHGSLPTSLVRIVTLRALNVEHNNLSGELPPFEERSLANLESISLRDNSFDGSLLSLIKALDDPVFSLDLSNNNFTDTIPVEIGQLKNLKSLDLSYNSLTGTLDKELVKLPLLKNLNLRNNALTGMVPDGIWSSDSKLINVNLRRNRLTGVNLTTWAINVLANKSFDANQQQVSLVANNIIDIILPSQDLFEQLYRSHSTGSNQQDAPSSTGFILVGGNPWCAELVGTNMSLVQRYLCRSSENEDFLESRFAEGNGGVSSRTLIIIGVTSGLLVLLMACILLVLLWRMGRRMYDLRQIQEELARDDVRPPFYKYEELKTATREFSRQNELGKGAFGAVYKAVLPDGNVVAVKRLFPNEQNVADFLKEMVLISGIKHRNLVLLKGCCVRDKQRMLVYEYAENKNLAEALWGEDRPFDLNWAQRVNICVGIARGLSYLHEELQPKIIHRDIKPQNILLDKGWNAKIADFGLARPIVQEDATQMATQIGGTVGYFSPEYATLGIFSEKLDVYSYGVLMLEIISGRRCINLNSPIEDEIYLRTWAFRLYGENKLLDIAAKGLVTESNRDDVLSVLKTALLCLQEDPNKRPTMSQVVSMLTDVSEVAIDIVTELRDQTFGVGYYAGQYDQTTTSTINPRHEREELALLDSASSAAGSQPTIELSSMQPR